MTALFDLGYPASEYKTSRAGYRGTSLQAFFARFPDEEACLAHVFRTRFGETPLCPKCGRESRWYRIAGYKRFQHPCGQAISPLGGTIFSHSRTPAQIWLYAMLHFSNSRFGVPSTFLRRHLGISTKAAHRMVDRIRLHMAAIDASKTVGKPGQSVEIRIEELLGIRTAHNFSRARPKAVFLGDDCSVQATLISRSRRHVLRAILADKLTPGAVAVTTCNYTHRVLSEFGTRSPSVRLVNEYVDPQAGINPIASFLRHFQRPMQNTYRRIDYANLWKYLKEFEFGFNRRMRSHEIFNDLVGCFPDISHDRAAELAAWSSRATSKGRRGT